MVDSRQSEIPRVCLRFPFLVLGCLWLHHWGGDRNVGLLLKATFWFITSLVFNHCLSDMWKHSKLATTKSKKYKWSDDQLRQITASKASIANTGQSWVFKSVCKLWWTFSVNISPFPFIFTSKWSSRPNEDVCLKCLSFFVFRLSRSSLN